MTRILTRLIGSLSLGLAASIAVAGAAQAQNAPVLPDRSKEWVKICAPDEQLGKEICQFMRDFLTESGTLISRVAIKEAEGEARRIMSVAVPSRVLLRQGVRFRVDEGKEFKAEFVICYPEGCWAETTVDAEFIDSMKRGNELTVVAINQRAKQIVINYSLAGFTAMYNGDPIDLELLRRAQQNQAQLPQKLEERAREQREKLQQQGE